MAKKKKHNAIKRVVSFLSSKKFKKTARIEARKSLHFLFLAFFSLFILFMLSSLVPLEFTELFVAKTVLFGLNAAGIQGEIIQGEPVGIKLNDGPSIEISYLCTGLLEMILLAGVIIASVGIPINKRIIGIAVGMPATVAVNFGRIFATIYFIYNSSIETVEFIHNVFFRVTLFITIFCFYALWFKWATRKKSKK